LDNPQTPLGSLTETLRKRILQQLAAWRADLINLARTNRLLYFRPTKVTTLEITEPDSQELLRVLLENHDKGLRLRYTPADEEDPEYGESLRAREIRASVSSDETLSKSLRELHRRSTQEYLDRGIWTLYFGIGQLEWVDEPGQAKERTEKAHSPLLLVPVELFQEGGQSEFYVKKSEEEIALNPALVVKLQHDMGIDINIPDDIDEENISEIFKFIEKQVSSQEGWRIVPKVVLSLFSFYKEAMYRDLQNNEETITLSELIQALALDFDSLARFDFDPVPNEQVDDFSPPESLCSILDADASQRQAIIAAQTDKSFIMDGPPGTGKSQTIANIIAELLAQEKTVLFVSEKAAALEVVYKRLAQTKLDDFVLELHSHKATRKEVAKRLGKSILSHPAMPNKMSADAISRLTKRRQELTDYAIALNEVRLPLGKTLHNVVGTVSKLQALPQSPHPKIDSTSLSAEALGEMLSAAELISRAWKPVEDREHFLWRDLKESRFDAARRVEISSLLRSAIGAIERLEKLAYSISGELLLEKPSDLTHIATVQAIERLLPAGPGIVPLWLTTEDFQALLARIESLKSNAARLKACQDKLDTIIGPSWQEINPQLGIAFQRTIKEILSCGEEWTPNGAMKSTDLELKAKFFKLTEELLNGIDLLLPDLSSIFADKTGNWELERVSRLQKVGELASQPYLPHRSWLSIGEAHKVRNASFRCQEAVRQYQSATEDHKEIFLPSILDLSLETLCIRFEKVYGPLRFLKRRYWEDRRLLSRHCVSGKFRKLEKTRLRGALAWKKSKDNYEYVDRIDGQQIGETYWRGLNTDFEMLESAIKIAEEVSNLSDLDINLEAIQNFVSIEGSRPARLFALTKEIGRLLEDWRKGVADDIVRAFWPCDIKIGQHTARRLYNAYGEIRQYIKQIEEIKNLDPDIMALADILDNRLRVSDIESWFEKRFEHDRVQFGEVFRGPNTNWDLLDSKMNWAKGMRDIFRGQIGEDIADRILCAPSRLADLDDAVDGWREKTELLCGLFEPAKSKETAEIINGQLADVSPFLQRLLETIDDIGIWDSFTKARQQLLGLGLSVPLDFCIMGHVPHATVPDTIKRSILEMWIDNILSADKRLKYLSAEDRNYFVREFCDLDKELIKRSTSRVIERCNSIRPKTMVGVSGIILHEAEKSRKHMPIRSLIERTAPVVKAIKPCFMMSPLSVSQFLPPGIRFDYVIFDEASQVKPADAINCIYRGNRLIVAGDQKQLPPTTFFERSSEGDDDTYDETSPDQFQSILDKCKASGAFTSIPLRWHYRSQHEELIAFSNYSFYEHGLITFPCAQTEAEDLGLELFYVEKGIYRRGTSRDNIEEARKIVERARYHCERYPRSSIGIVAFSEAQAFLIEMLIRQEAIRSPHLRSKLTDDRLDGIFIKNLETVQGDERDTIIFSVGYGRDEVGKFTLNFGPINKPEGWRRLNVAITRARRRIEVVTSVLPDDFPAEIPNRNIAFLRKYLEYAGKKENRISVLAMEERLTDAETESPFEEEVARVIEGWGYSVAPQVGCAEYRIDLGVRHPQVPSRFILGIECDGAMYHSSRVARDRDRLRQEVLEGLGWSLYRIWGPSWYRHRSQQEMLLKKALEGARQKSESKRKGEEAFNLHSDEDCEETETQSAPEPPVRTNLNSHPDWAEEYQVADTKGLCNTRYEIHDSFARPALDRVVKKILDVEAPVHISRIVQAVKKAWGVTRAGNRINEAIISSLRRQGARRKGEIYEATYSRTKVRLPNPGNPDTERTVDEVPADELAMAIKNLVADAKAIKRDELVRAVSRLYGWERCGDMIRSKLSKIIIKLPGITEDGENIVISNGSAN